MTTSQHSAIKLARFVAAGFGSGWLPKAPGTWGSLLSLAPATLVVAIFGASGVLAGALLLTLLGVVACRIVLPTLTDSDPGWIVIDEWAGQWLALALALAVSPMGWLTLLLAFLLFRLFDIVKPGPVAWAEKVGPDWWSIMADDLVAALLAGLIACALLLALT